VITLTEIEALTPHIASKIEPGAILVSRWGYDQTNIDFYMVVRTTEVSCWVLPMSTHEEPAEVYATAYVTPVDAQTHSSECECGHRAQDHAIDECKWCSCDNPVYRQLAPKRHKIVRYSSTEGINITSFSGALLWEGQPERASHYA